MLIINLKEIFLKSYELTAYFIKEYNNISFFVLNLDLILFALETNQKTYFSFFTNGNLKIFEFPGQKTWYGSKIFQS
jgi:hypothetical protein